MKKLGFTSVQFDFLESTELVDVAPVLTFCGFGASAAGLSLSAVAGAVAGQVHLAVAAEKTAHGTCRN